MFAPGTLPSLLADEARRRPGQAALVALGMAEGAADLPISPDGLLDEAAGLAAALQGRLPQGARLVLVFPNEAGFVRLFWACVLAGIIAVPAAPPRNAIALARLDQLVATAGAGLVVVARSLGPLIARLRQQSALPVGAPEWLSEDAIGAATGYRAPALTGQSLALLQFTSGSTGRQKGVMVRHANLLANLDCLASVCGRGPGMRMVTWLPFFHDWGLVGCLLFPIHAGGTGYFFDPADFLRRPRRWIELMAEHRATVTCAPDFAYRLAAEAAPEGGAEGGPPLDLSAWRLAMLGAEPVRAATMESFARAWRRHGFRPEALYPSYGLAENTLIVTGGPPGRPWRLGGQGFTNCGAPLGETRVAIVDPQTGLPADPGATGEIWISGPCVAAGYWQAPEATEAAFGASLPGEGGRWLRSGDLGFLDGGELFICGRLKDVVIKAGANHLAEDLEATMEAADPALRPGCGAAFGVEAEGAERMVLVQELRYGPRPDLPPLIGAIQRAIAASHGVMADAIAILPPGTLEKTSSGKIRRGHVRDQFRNGQLSPLLAWQSWQAAPDEG